MHRYRIGLCLLLVWPTLILFSQARGPAQESLVQRLGYPAGTQLLIIHADDLAVTHATNTASFAALERGSVSSASVMANCPWLAEVGRYARTHPEADLGMHLTLTSEWRDLRWGSTAPADQVQSLLDSSGYLKPLCQLMVADAKPEEVRIELRAQIDRALSLGLRPTHLDTHMGCLIASPQLFAVYLEVAREYDIPAMVSNNELAASPAAYRDLLRPEDLVIDYLFTAGMGEFETGLEAYYRNLLADLPVGVSVLLIHTALDGSESAGMAGGVEGWGNRWRQIDYNFFTSDALKTILEKENIQLTTWRDLHRRWKKR